MELFDGLTGTARIGPGLAAVGRPGYINPGRGAAALHLRPEHLDRLSALAETPDRYWATRAGLAWP